MSLIKSIAVPLATVGAICGVLALTAPANAGTAANTFAQQECDSRVRRGSIQFQSQYDQCIRQQTALGNTLFGSSEMDAFLEGFNEGFGGNFF